jgi:hypothetical protein
MKSSIGIPVSCVLVAVLVAACSVPPPRGGISGATRGLPAPSPAGPAEPAPRAGAALYRIDPQASEIRVLVYRAGALANLGHNHVLLLRPDQGWIESTASIAASSFYLQFPLERVIVDDATLRGQEGADFPGDIPEDAKQGTARNMLGEALLDAAHHPLLIIRSAAIAAHGEGFTAIVHVNVAGHESNLSATFTREESGADLVTSGQLNLRQSELGLKPFSIMLGALQVQDQMVVKFRIVAKRS